MKMHLPYWKSRPTPNLGMVLLTIWLIAMGLLQLFPALNFRYSATILPLLAIAAGVVILLDVRTSTLFLTVSLLAVVAALVILLK